MSRPFTYSEILIRPEDIAKESLEIATDFDLLTLQRDEALKLKYEASEIRVQQLEQELDACEARIKVKEEMSSTRQTNEESGMMVLIRSIISTVESLWKSNKDLKREVKEMRKKL